MQAPSTGVIPREKLVELVRLATLAPSGHNTQPWKFAIEGSTVRIFPDYSRRLPAVDPDDHALYIGLGCAVENLVIGAENSGFSADVECFPAGEPAECLLVHLGRAATRGNARLCHAIPERQSTRRAYDGRMPPPSHLRQLEEASREEGVGFRLFTEPREIEPLIEFVREGSRVQFRDPAFVEELLTWIRFSHTEVEAHADGLTAAVMGLPSVPRWVGRPIMKAFTRPDAEARRAEKMIRSSAALMLFLAEENQKKNWVDLGRSFERVALTATALGIRHAHLNMPCEVQEVRGRLASHLKLGSAQPLLLLRIGYAPPMPRAPRRPLDRVLIGGSFGHEMAYSGEEVSPYCSSIGRRAPRRHHGRYRFTS